MVNARPLFHSFLPSNFYTTVDFSGIQTQIHRSRSQARWPLDHHLMNIYLPITVEEKRPEMADTIIS